MKAINFNWKNGIYLVIGELEIDLHNRYAFCTMQHDVSVRTMRLVWRKLPSGISHCHLPAELTIEVLGVATLEVRPRNMALPYTEDNCLSSFGYETDESWVDGQFCSDNEPESHWRWSFEFQSGAAIVIAGDSASVRLQP